MDHETIEEVKRHFGIVAEALRSDVRAVAEGLQAHREDFQSFRQQLAGEFDDTRGIVRLSYGELDRRVRSLETEVADLRDRLERVEGRLAS